jgi:uncharacterized membrane protein YadS
MLKLVRTDEGCAGRARAWAVASSDDWWSVWLGLAFLAACIGMAHATGSAIPELASWTRDPLAPFNSAPAAQVWVVLPLMGLATQLSLLVRGKPTDGFWTRGYPLVALLALASKFLGAQAALHGAGMGAAVWAVILGAVVANAFWWNARPAAFKATLDAGLEEFWIKVGLVLLAIDFDAVIDLGYHGLVVAFGDTCVVLCLSIAIGRVLLGMPLQVTIVTAAALSICGTSAASAVGAAMNLPQGSPVLAVPIAVMSLMTVPVIPLLPPLGAALGLDQTVTGAWIGGSVDTTGAVVASAAISGPTALRAASIVKMLQNTSICVVALLVAALPGLAAAEPGVEAAARTASRHAALGPGVRNLTPPLLGSSDAPASAPPASEARGAGGGAGTGTGAGARARCAVCGSTLWARFPKFTLGFLATSLVVSFGVGPEHKAAVSAWSFSLSEWFSTLGFVGIGLNLRLRTLWQGATATRQAAPKALHRDAPKAPDRDTPKASDCDAPKAPDRDTPDGAFGPLRTPLAQETPREGEGAPAQPPAQDESGGERASEPNPAPVLLVFALYCLGQLLDLVITAPVAYYSFSGVDKE